MVIVLLEERCLSCSEILTGTLELLGDASRTGGDFSTEHAIDVQSGGADRILRAINASGECPSCHAPFSFKTFSVMQTDTRRRQTAGDQA